MLGFLGSWYDINPVISADIWPILVANMTDVVDIGDIDLKIH